MSVTTTPLGRLQPVDPRHSLGQRGRRLHALAGRGREPGPARRHHRPGTGTGVHRAQRGSLPRRHPLQGHGDRTPGSSSRTSSNAPTTATWASCSPTPPASTPSPSSGLRAASPRSTAPRWTGSTTSQARISTSSVWKLSSGGLAIRRSRPSSTWPASPMTG